MTDEVKEGWERTHEKWPDAVGLAATAIVATALVDAIGRLRGLTMGEHVQSFRPPHPDAMTAVIVLYAAGAARSAFGLPADRRDREAIHEAIEENLSGLYATDDAGEERMHLEAWLFSRARNVVRREREAIDLLARRVIRRMPSEAPVCLQWSDIAQARRDAPALRRRAR